MTNMSEQSESNIVDQTPKLSRFENLKSKNIDQVPVTKEQVSAEFSEFSKEAERKLLSSLEKIKIYDRKKIDDETRYVITPIIIQASDLAQTNDLNPQLRKRYQRIVDDALSNGWILEKDKTDAMKAREVVVKKEKEDQVNKQLANIETRIAPQIEFSNIDGLISIKNELNDINTNGLNENTINRINSMITRVSNKINELEQKLKEKEDKKDEDKQNPFEQHIDQKAA